jgi:hypothetical protein
MLRSICNGQKRGKIHQRRLAGSDYRVYYHYSYNNWIIGERHPALSLLRQGIKHDDYP